MREVESENRWSAGAEVKLTYVILEWIGITIGYRAPFADLLGGAFLVSLGYVVPRVKLSAHTGG